MRFIPNVGFGTEGYPEKVARRLRAANIGAWIGASTVAFFAVWRFLDGSAHWKYAALVALAFGLAPLLHRFGPLTAPLALAAILYTWTFWISLTIGTSTTYFLMSAGALGILLIGAERVFLTVVIGAVAAGLNILLHIVMRPPAASLAFIVAQVVNVLSSSAVLYVIIFYAVRQLTRAEAELELANLAKSRILAVASHDLRQPLHALGLFVGQLRIAATASERARIVAQVDTAIATMNELFNALLDISKLDAGTLTPNITEFPMIKLLELVETTFARTAADAGLDLRVIPSDAWVRSDFVLLEQVLLNLVSNAVHYTSQGGVLIGCRKRGEQLRIEIWDTGPGIPEDQRQKIFGEFYRLSDAKHDGKGLGLGLAIVDRLCRLLGHSVELSSNVGRGSRFTVVVPRAAESTTVAEPPVPAAALLNVAVRKLVVVIDDDALALDGMAGLLRGWGCRVVAARSAKEALVDLTGAECSPDLIISDFHLSGRKTGSDAIQELHVAFGAPVPTLLVSGDISPALLEEARRQAYPLLHKPVDPMSLRTMLNRLLKKKPLSLP